MAMNSVALAVQGGGSHGAFSWGVLDRLLDEVAEDRLHIAALSGASAGGFNAALAAYGLGKAPGAEGARIAQRVLADFWLGDAHLAPFSLFSNTAQAWHQTTGSWNIDDTPTVLGVDLAEQLLSPYVMPRIEWLKLALGRAIDFAELRRQTGGPELYITATNITHNRRDIFARTAITYDVLAASACIPTVFPARPLKTDGATDYYWDGGYMGNPSLMPLTGHASDLIVIQVNPFARPGSPPRTVPAIQNRINEITFNSALVLELSTITALDREIAEQGGNGIFLHRIADEAYMASLGYASKLVILQDFIEELRRVGRATADSWLRDPARGGQLGKQSTLDQGILQRIVTHAPIIRHVHEAELART